VHVEQHARLAAHGEETHRAGAMVLDRPVEAMQLRANVFEDAVGIDRARRILRVERDEAAQVVEGGF
jgi:hypothetical protein